MDCPKEPEWRQQDGSQRRRSTRESQGHTACQCRVKMKICGTTVAESGGLHSHGGTPIAGWFISWKIP